MSPQSGTGIILPWPECLGVFDEESCRYFLRELGQRIVQFYPFSVGIDEVYAQIVDEYGFSGAPDAISVLQELLEDDSTAAGIGDDGDIWRSWRHSWRHRNVNSRNPSVPRVRGQILPPPTPLRVRLLKNANFVARQLKRVEAGPSSLEVPCSSSDSDQTKVKVGHETRAISLRRSGRSILDSTAENRRDSLLEKLSSFVDEDVPGEIRVDTEDISDEKVLLLSQTYGTISSSSNPCPSSNLQFKQPRQHGFPFNIVSPRRRNSAISPPSETSKSSTIGVIAEKASSSITAKTTSSFGSTTSPDRGREIDAGKKRTISSAHASDARVNRFSLPPDLGPTSREVTPTKRRASHRQARMIDGALFDGQNRKGKFVQNVDTSTDSVVNDARENEVYSHLTDNIPRKSWLRNVWTRFHGERRRSSAQPKLRKQHSSLTSCGLVSSPRSPASKVMHLGSSKIAEMTQTTPLTVLGLDGTCEQHLNKPLPLSPGDRGRPSMQSDIHRTFFGRSPKPSTLSTETTTLPAFPQESASHQGTDLASLVSATMAGPHELSPREKLWRYRFSDSSFKSGPASPSSFATFAKKNPYQDSSEPSTPTTPMLPAPLACQKQEVSSVEWPFRTSHDLHDDIATVGTQLTRQATPYHASCVGHPSGCNTGQMRGRKPSTPISQPTLQGPQTHSSPPKTPPPRSRSPVKRLIGMVKSMSTNQISDGVESPMQDANSSANKRKWKELSNKLRHGFLTADIEQLEQEEMMEEYTNHSAVHILTPPPSRRRGPLPVSIKSSGQNKLWSELEFMLIEASNNFLKDELEHGRLSRESIIRTKKQWQAHGRPQVIEFYYDQATQYDIIIANLRTVKLYSDYAEDAIMLNSVLHQWKILIRELSVKTLCMPDSIVRRWLHDGRRVLELLGAPSISLAHLDRLSGLCFALFSSAEKDRVKQRGRSDTTQSHRRSASDGSQNTLAMHEQALMEHGMSGGMQAPPLPTPRSMGNVSRKVTPQEQRLAQKARKSTEKERAMLINGGRKSSKSLTSADERSRFVIE